MEGQYASYLTRAACTVALVVVGRSFIQIAREVVKAVRVYLDLPGPEQDLILGNVRQAVASPIHRLVEQWAREYGPVYRMRFLHRTIVVVAQPEVAAAVLRAGPAYLPKYRPSYTTLETITLPYHQNIVTTHDSDPYWRALRRAVAPAFTTNNLRAVFPGVVSSARAVASHLLAACAASGGAGVDVDGAAQRLTVDVIGRLLFGLELRACDFAALRNEPLTIVSNLFQGLQLQLNPLNRLMPWRKEARFYAHWRDRYNQLIGDLVARATASGPPPPHTILARLLEATDPHTGAPLSAPALRSEAGIMLVAGFETTAHTIAWALFLLATHPEEQDALAGELATHGLLATRDAPSPRPMAWPDLGGLRRLDAVVAEALRLFPAASAGTAREATRDIQVAGRTIRKGTMIWFPTWTIHRDPATWGPDAHLFKPGRWLPADYTPSQPAAPPATTTATSSSPKPAEGRPAAGAAGAAGGDAAGAGVNSSSTFSIPASGAAAPGSTALPAAAATAAAITSLAPPVLAPVPSSVAAAPRSGSGDLFPGHHDDGEGSVHSGSSWVVDLDSPAASLHGCATPPYASRSTTPLPDSALSPGRLPHEGFHLLHRPPPPSSITSSSRPDSPAPELPAMARAASDTAPGATASTTTAPSATVAPTSSPAPAPAAAGAPAPSFGAALQHEAGEGSGSGGAGSGSGPAHTAASGPRARGGFMPFSLGPRDCVGQALAVMEARVAVATLVGHARFSLAPESRSYDDVASAARQYITLKPVVPGSHPPRPGLMLLAEPRV
uniref:Cytochrome P450 n=1 Tax=Chlamydomonas leiostraca TaxID=1034604 RepID=A0A7S0WZP2_9CHLO|mmetsp:Transcript_38180/g.96634  ORF Transcript_38180/g.96634 Transcript_38180/m.96634 type:complete len:783 (+) Transcript_38180:128-2476(+)